MGVYMFVCGQIGLLYVQDPVPPYGTVSPEKAGERVI